jgi:type IV fimbrial biogenesis protein FimT
MSLSILRPTTRRTARLAHLPPARCRGLSLIECCAVLAVLSVLLGLAVPSFADHLAKRRLEGRAVELSNDLQFLRSEAVSRNEAMRITFGSDAGGACYVLHAADAEGCACTSDGRASCEPGEGPQGVTPTPLRSVGLPAADGVALASNVKSIMIDPRLGTSTPGGTIRLSDRAGREIRQVVNIMARVRSCTPAGRLPGYKRC